MSTAIIKVACPGLACSTVNLTAPRLAGSPVRSSLFASHATGASNRDTTLPLLSTKSTPPSADGFAVNPRVRNGTDHDNPDTGFTADLSLTT
ncbi:hypothetical protein GGG17_08120 [Arsenicicoccus sp. MKL-02]|uniref:Uncharacterized protein n=1 Tax=Arsenicicoccus cauae TaxID=2663847 RepID=A0A6I3IYE8_9MICO|nr:hypothetical protein [Arsenicicoccus cauae]